MPNWGLLLLVVFMSLGLMRKPKWNVNAVAIGATVIVLLGVAAKEHLLL